MKDYLYYFLSFALSFVVPKKKNLIIFGGGDARQFQGNPKYLLLFLQRCQPDSKFEYYWSSKSKAQQNYLRENGIPFINPYSVVGFLKTLRAQYLVIEKSAYDAFYYKMINGRFNFIQTWHGTPLKMIGTDIFKKNTVFKIKKNLKLFSMQKYKLVLAAGEKYQAIFSHTFLNKNVVLTGFPRNDVFFNHNLLMQRFDEIFKLKNFNKIILYAPTFRDHKDRVVPFEEDLSTYNQKLKENNYLLLIKKHPWEKVLSIPEGLSNIWDISDKVDDIQEILTFTDLLISDYSSVFFDFIVTQKPILFYPYDFEEYLSKSRELYIDYFKDLPGPFVKNEKELFDHIFSMDEWFQHSEYQDKYSKLLKQFNKYCDGNASQRVLNILFPQSI